MENSVFYDQNDFMNDYYLDRESVINNYDKSFKIGRRRCCYKLSFTTSSDSK